MSDYYILTLETPTKLRLMVQVLSVHFGAVPTPDAKFEWAFTDKHKAFKREEHTPLGFYEDVVPTKVDEMVSIINDPRNPYHKYVRVLHL